MAAVADKAAAHCAEKKYDEVWFLGRSRLFPDMFRPGAAVPAGERLRSQYSGSAGWRRICRTFPATDATTFADVKARLEKSLDYVKGFTPAQIDGTEDKDIDWTAARGRCHSKGSAYLLHFGLPNFYFHATTAYNILRHQRRRDSASATTWARCNSGGIVLSPAPRRERTMRPVP